MAAKIQKWGNSLGVRIPKSVIEKTKLDENSEVEIECKNGNIIIMPAKREYTLSDLLDEITPSNLHTEDDFLPEGNETW